MNIIRKSFFVFLFALIGLSFLSCKSATADKKSVEEKGEISSVLAYTEHVDMSHNSSEVTMIADFAKIPNNDILVICYETTDLFKIEILGKGNNISILMNDKLFRNNINLDGSYSITGKSVIHEIMDSRKSPFNLIIKQGDSTLWKFEIIYDGCQ